MSNTKLAEKNNNAGVLSQLAQSMNIDPARLVDTLKNTVFKGASDTEFVALCVVANKYGLNPLLKEIYAFPAKGGGIVPVVSVDGWIQIINSHPQLDGIDFADAHGDDGSLVSCTCTIYRKDRERPVRVTEYLSECKRTTEPWKMEHRMLRHKALIQCARIAFGFSGLVEEDEARVISVRDVPQQTAPHFPFPSEQIEEKPKPKPKKQVQPSPAEDVGDGEEDTESGFAGVGQITVKKGTKESGQEWSLFTVDLALAADRSIHASTFSRRVAEICKAAREADEEVYYQINRNDNGNWDLADAKRINEPTEEEGGLI